MPYTAGPYAGPPGGPGGPGGLGGPGIPGVGPYGQPPRRTTNGLAVGSLVSGIVCCLPPLGLVLGLVALPQIRKRDQAGKGLAVAGIVLSALSSLLLVIGIATGGIGTFWGGFKEGMDEAARSKSPFSLRTGQCFTPDGRLRDYATDVTVVDCARPHIGEVTGGFKVTGFEKWPGEDAIDGMAEERCETINSGYALDTWAVPADVWLFYYLPSSQSWRLGDRTVTCAFASEKKPFKGSVRSDAQLLTDDQESFLKTVNPIETVTYREPEEDPDEDFTANKVWATELLGAINTAYAELGQRTWPAEAAPSVAALRKELGAASKQWLKLATATDADAYWEAYDPAWETLPEDLGADARTALDLTGAPPVGPAGEGTSA
ncbi:MULTISPECIES: DUF4190 domain-containing protein [unclassified Streptomyces]|uniref:DUF4190 domain-containing protein n=1 Tax=unclassified Streptomyces TaxID=2593676 RepID=UPI001E3234A8|nr:DUF4190 domain-containing protein [Streptomyces sp. MBT42]MCD2464651.1 DUF4190 domain-containing protein [Streptomyces sp. MBT42]